MPRRPKQHQVEDLSLNALRNILPREWVFREKGRDYGIDGEIEIFDKDDRATGMVFLVQLKATDTSNKYTKKQVKLNVASINYYQSLELPVLIVRYPEEDKKLYIRWAHELDRNDFHDQDTFSFTMKESEQWQDKTPEHLINTLKKYSGFKSKSSITPIKTYLDFSFSEFCNMDTKRVKSYFRDRILGQKPSLVQIVTNRAETVAKIELSKKGLSIYFVGIPGCHFSHIDETSFENIDDLFSSVFVAFAIALNHLSKPGDALKIIESYGANSPILKSPKVALSFIGEYMKQGDVEKAEKLWANIPHEAKDDDIKTEFQMLFSLIEQALGQDLSSIQEKFILDEIREYDQKKEAEKLSASHCNYANHLRKNNRLKESIAHYIKALRASGYYSQSDYFYKEMAGVLFRLDRFRISAKLYEYGLSLKEDDRGVSLYADALMLKGDYLLAQKNFEKYFVLSNNHDPIWVLKSLVLEYIMEALKIESQHRSYKRAMNTEAIKGLGVRDVSREELLGILAIDALSPLAWFNLAADYAKTNEYTACMAGYLICSLINIYDSESWERAFETSLRADRLDIVPLVVEAGFKYLGEGFLQNIYDIIDNKMEFENADFQQSFYGSIEQIVEKVNQEKDQKKIKFNGIEILI